LPPNSNDGDASQPSYTATASASINAVLTDAGESPHPPPFSSLFFPSEDTVEERNKPCETRDDESPPAFAPAPPFTESSSSAAAAAAAAAVAATKAALPHDTKDASSSKDIDDGEPPPPYTEGSSPLESFAYVMASAGGPASIITQVSQSSAGPPINTLGGSDENITLELRYDHIFYWDDQIVNQRRIEEHALRYRVMSFSLSQNLFFFRSFLMAYSLMVI
jgi:ATP-binding cassette subfamily F protein 3